MSEAILLDAFAPPVKLVKPISKPIKGPKPVKPPKPCKGCCTCNLKHYTENCNIKHDTEKMPFIKPSYRRTKFSRSNNSISSSTQTSSTTTLIQRPSGTSISNLDLGVSVLEDKRRDFQDTLLVSADILDTTRRESRRSMMQNLGSTADLLDSTRRGMRKSIGQGIKRNVNRVRTLGNTKKDYPDDDQSFFCVGDKEIRDSQDEQRLDEDEKEEEEPLKSLGRQSRKSSLWIVIGMATRREELRESVINGSFVATRDKPLPMLPTHYENEEERLI